MFLTDKHLDFISSSKGKNESLVLLCSMEFFVSNIFVGLMNSWVHVAIGNSIVKFFYITILW